MFLNYSEVRGGVAATLGFFHSASTVGGTLSICLRNIAIFGVQVHPGDQILVARLNGILEPFSVALKRGVQRRVCNPAFQGGGLTIRVRRYDACFNSKVSDAGQHDQCENYVAGCGLYEG